MRIGMKRKNRSYKIRGIRNERALQWLMDLRRSAWHHSETNFYSMGDAPANEVKKQDRSPSLERTKKPAAVKTAAEGEYNRFNITPFHLCIIYTAPFHLILVLVIYN